MMDKKKIVKELNTCLKMMDNRVIEGSVNTQIELVSNMIRKDYSVDEDFDKDIDTLKKVSDYNVRKKVLKDLIRKYVR
jgi:hypothetical protein